MIVMIVPLIHSPNETIVKQEESWNIIYMLLFETSGDDTL